MPMTPLPPPISALQTETLSATTKGDIWSSSLCMWEVWHLENFLVFPSRGFWPMNLPSSLEGKERSQKDSYNPLGRGKDPQGRTGHTTSITTKLASHLALSWETWGDWRLCDSQSIPFHPKLANIPTWSQNPWLGAQGGSSVFPAHCPRRQASLSHLSPDSSNNSIRSSVKENTWWLESEIDRPSPSSLLGSYLFIRSFFSWISRSPRHRHEEEIRYWRDMVGMEGKSQGRIIAVLLLKSPVRLFVTLWTAARQASLSFTISQSLLKLMSIESVIPFNHLILCHPLLLLPSIFPSIRVFFNQLALRIRWPKYWCFSFSICPPNEWKAKVSVAQSCPTLCNPMDCSPPGSSIHGIFQASILEWVAIPLNIPMNTQGWFPLGLTWSPCGPRDPQESFPEPQFKSEG